MVVRRSMRPSHLVQMERKGETIHIHDTWCKACGICVALCPQNVLAINEMGYPYVANEEACTRCGLCELHCPDFAIDIYKAGEVPFDAAHRTYINEGNNKARGNDKQGKTEDMVGDGGERKKPRAEKKKKAHTK